MKGSMSKYHFVIGVYIVLVDYRKPRFKVVTEIASDSNIPFTASSSHFEDNFEDVLERIEKTKEKFGKIETEVLKFDEVYTPEEEERFVKEFLRYKDGD
jgi:hypothetical protein